MPGAGRQRPDRTETLLSALRRPRLPPPRSLATAGEAEETADFSPVRGALRRAHGTRTAVGHAAAPGPPQGDGARAARSVRRRRRIWRGGPQGLETPGGGREPSPPPRLWGTSFGSIVPARTEGAGRRAPPGVEGRPRGSRGPARSPAAGGRSRERGRLPAQATADSPQAEPQRPVR